MRKQPKPPDSVPQPPRDRTLLTSGEPGGSEEDGGGVHCVMCALLWKRGECGENLTSRSSLLLLLYPASASPVRARFCI